MIHNKTSLRCICFLILAVSCNTVAPQERSSDPGADDRAAIYKLLPEGERQVDMMDHVTMPARTQELMTKFQTAMQKDPEWFLEAKQKVEETGQPLPYDERVGMTESEFNEFLSLMQPNKGMVMAKSGTERVTITHSDNKITFKNDDRLELLNRVVIDLLDFSVRFADYQLTPMQQVDISTDDNGLQSSWSGYEWRYEESDKEVEELQSVEDYRDLSMTICKVIVARLHKTQKTYMHVQYTQYKNGREIINYQMPLIFQ